MFPAAIFIFVLIFNSVICEKKPCDIDDSKCVTESGNLALGELILGNQNVEPSDPLNLESIEANLPNLWFKLDNVSLSGMIKCHIEFMKMVKKDLKYECHLRCPHLTLDSEYEIKGDLGSVFLEGKGTGRVDYYDYNLYFSGDYENKIKNGKEHLYFKNNKLDLEVKEKTHYDITNLFNGDKEKSDAVLKQLNENWKMVDKTAYLAVMEPLMNKYVKNVNTYSNIVPAQAFFAL